MRIVNLRKYEELDKRLRPHFSAEPRPFQAAIANKLLKLLTKDEAKKNLLVVIEAPTGLGKTRAVGAVLTALKLRTLWLVRTIPQALHVSSELAALGGGGQVIPFVGRHHLCVNPELANLRAELFYVVCRMARLKKLGKTCTAFDEGRCPYERQLELLNKRTDVVVGTHMNMMRLLRLVQPEIIVIDEVHNFPLRRRTFLLEKVWQELGVPELGRGWVKSEELLPIFVSAAERYQKHAITLLAITEFLLRHDEVYIDRGRLIAYQLMELPRTLPVVGLSATPNLPLLRKLAGDREVIVLRAGWPFHPKALRAWVVKGVTTKFETRNESADDYKVLIQLLKNYYDKIAVFTVSHEYLRRLQWLTENKDDIFDVYQGRLAEGIDLKVDAILAAGIPFPPPDEESQRLMEYLTRHGFSENEARLHAVVLPALFATVQAAGRGVRGPDDKCDVFLADDRFSRLLPLLPR